MHFKTVINFSACQYWLKVVVDFLAQNSCFDCIGGLAQWMTIV